MASNSSRCSGSGSSSHYTLTVYGNVKSYSSQTRQGEAEAYAVLSADSGYAFADFDVVVTLYIGDLMVGIHTIHTCGNTSTYKSASTSVFSLTHIDYGNDGTLSQNVRATLSCSSSSIYPPKSCDVSTTLVFPSIDPVSITPTCSLGNIAINSGGLNGNAIAGISTLKASISSTNASSVVAWYETSGITKSLNVASGYATSDTIPASDSDYTITFKAYAISSTNTKSDVVSKTLTVKGYSLPTYGDGTYTFRANSGGDESATGAYGKLHLTWKISNISGNSLQSIGVKVNGSAISAKEGSVDDGFYNFIFNLGEENEGNIEVTIRDSVASNTIKSLFVPKTSMPFSLYDDGSQVAATFGEMASYNSNGGAKYVGFARGTKMIAIDSSGNQIVKDAAEVLSGSGGSGRQIYVQTTATIPSGAVEGDIVIVYEA